MLTPVSRAAVPGRRHLFGIMLAVLSFGLIPTVERTPVLAEPTSRRSRPDIELLAQPEKLVDTVVREIEANYAKLQTLRVTIRATLLDSRVETRQTIVRNVAGGGYVVIVRSPKRSRTEKVILEGEKIRHERYANATLTDVFTVEGDSYMRYQPQEKRATTGKNRPGVAPLDPRRPASRPLKQPLLEQIKNDEVVQTRLIERPDGSSRVRILLKHTYPRSQRVRRYACEFDPGRNYLPTRVIYYSGEGTIDTSIEVTYRKVLPDAWFVHRRTIRFFSETPADRPDAETWTQKRTWETQGEIHVNQPVSKATFDIDLAPGTEWPGGVKEISVHRASEGG